MKIASFFFVLFVLSQTVPVSGADNPINRSDFAPIALGSEWIYHDTLWTGERVIGSALPEGSRRYIRTIRIIDSISSGGNDRWRASVHLTGGLLIDVAESPYRKIDTTFFDTLRTPPDGIFSTFSVYGAHIYSKGQIGLFPWLEYESTMPGLPGEKKDISQRAIGDTITVFRTSNSFSSGMTAVYRVSMCVAVRSVGMVYGEAENRSTMLGISGLVSRLMQYNGKTIDAEAYYTLATPVKRSARTFGKSVPAVRTKEITVITNRPMLHDARFDLRGCAVSTMHRQAPGLYLHAPSCCIVINK